MQSIRRLFAALVAVLACALPASAQMAGNDSGQGSSLIMVWVWILIFGVTIMIVGTSMGMRGRR